MRENTKAVWAKFLTLSKAVLPNSNINETTQAQAILELKTQPRFRPAYPWFKPRQRRANYAGQLK